jgi:hypothetical protein
MLTNYGCELYNGEITMKVEQIFVVILLGGENE